jgi:hypothetical protein
VITIAAIRACALQIADPTAASRSAQAVTARRRNGGSIDADVGKRPTWRHLLIRDDTSGEFSPDNCRWRGRPKHRRRRPHLPRLT